MKKYLLVHVDKTTGDEVIMEEYDILLIEPQIIVDDSYNYMCLYDRKNTIVELREMVNEYNYNILADMSFEKKLTTIGGKKQWLRKKEYTLKNNHLATGSL